MMSNWIPAEYGATIARLIAEPRLNALGPGSPNVAAHEQLGALRLETLGDGRPVKNRAMAEACCAALWLWHDYLDESHRISQDIQTLEGK
jgi:hypothetical protein